MVAASGQIDGTYAQLHVSSVSADVVCQECSSVTSLCLPFPFPISLGFFSVIGAHELL